MRLGPTVYFIVPLTENAEDWICENISNPKYQREGIVVERQHLADIVEGMIEAGLREDEDFCVNFKQKS